MKEVQEVQQVQRGAAVGKPNRPGTEVCAVSRTNKMFGSVRNSLQERCT